MASPVADSYSVASGGTIYAGMTAPLPAWLQGAAVHELVAISGSTPSISAGLVPAVAGSMGSQSGMVNAWCGGWVYGGKFYIHGGGHGDYGGNETGVLDLLVGVPGWDLLAERTPVGDLLGGSNYYADGKPTSRHTYYAMWPISDAGMPKMLRLNANMGFAYNGTPVGGSADVRTVDIDALNLSTGAWETAYGAMPRITGSDTSSAQHPTTGDIYVWYGPDNIIEMFDVSAGTSSQLADLTGTEGLGGALVCDAANGRLIRFGGLSATNAVYWPLAGGSKTTLTMSGSAASAVAALNTAGIGIAHDTSRNVVYLYASTTIYRVDLDTLEATTVTPTGETLGAPTNGWYGRVKYVPEIDAVVSLANWTSPVLAMRCGV